MAANRERERRMRPLSAVRSVREHARVGLQRAVGMVVASSIEVLNEHLPNALPVPRASSAATERTRTVLAIDRSTRAQAAALVVAPAPRPMLAPTGVAEGRTDVRVPCDEPIRTRSMARLLAQQGHPQRALSILEYLLARNAADAELRAEAEAVRAVIAAGS
jgi:hypothetical protein